MRKADYNVLIAGTGVAGLCCALNLPADMQVLLLSKAKADESDSFLAQGGICMLRGKEDFFGYFEDTVRAGHYENDPAAVRTMIESSPAMIAELVSYGVRFARDGAGNFRFTREGGHRRPRILFHGDETGKEITSHLLAAVRALPNVTVRENAELIDLLAEGNECFGGVVRDAATGGTEDIYADFTLLATGGVGGLYKDSTNFRHLTGDALAIALRRGVHVEHVNYVQIHPTTFYTAEEGRRFLISESVRGEGAVLLDKNGNRFCNELMPRDVVTGEIREQMQKDDTDHVWLDMRPVGKTVLEEHFPTICAHCREKGFDVLKEPVPVVPAQHYFMGGVKVDLNGKTSMKRLFAAGETACNGVHGRNRLASNSLLESLIWAKRAAKAMAAVRGLGIGRFPVSDKRMYQNYTALKQAYADAVREEAEREECCD